MMTPEDAASEKVTSLLADALTPDMLTGWTLVAEVITEDGEAAIWDLHNDGATPWAILGRLAWARQLQARREAQG